MNLTALLAFALALAPGGARADGDQAFLGIFAETTAMKMAGMPAMPKIELPPGVKLPAGVKLPTLPPGIGQPERKLTVRLWSPGIAPDDATASLAVPDGLKLGPKLDLAIYRPTAESGKETPVGPPGQDPFSNTELVIKRYWGSSPTVKDGQPEVTEFKGLTDEQKAVMREQARKMQRVNSYFYKPDWTTAYWPTDKQPGRIDADAVMQGHYALTTSYTGNVEIDVPSEVNFLDPIEMSSPALESAVSMDDAITFRWKAIPNALGYHANIFGMIGRNTIIMWSSSEEKPQFGVNYDYMQMAEVRENVKKNIFMAGDRTEVTVPAGIFKDCDMVMFQMIGYGPGTALDKGQPLPRVQSKTTLSIMLGGKKMPGFGPGGRGRPQRGDDNP